jgi:hypothetical protein
VSGLRVLAVTQDRAFLREVRVVLPLCALESLGLVSGFSILDPVTGELSGREGLEAFDAILVQREAPPRLAEALARSGLPFAYDLDDLLLNSASYRREQPDNCAREFVTLAARACHRLLVPHRRLPAALKRHLGLDLDAKTVLAPNLCPLDRPVSRPASAPRCLVWTTSDLPALAASRQAVLRAVREFSRARNMAVRLVGRFDRDVLQALPGAVFHGPMDYWRHKFFLLNLPPAIALAPLETRADPETQEFVDCKSDVKMAEYGGLGLAGIYSRAAPYLDTDLKAGLLAENTAEAWREALEQAAAAHPRRWAEQSLAIVRARSALKATPSSWGLALAECRLDRPLALSRAQDVLGLRRPPVPGARGGYPPHHRLADRLYHGLYLRLVPLGWRRTLGRWFDRLA